MASIDDEIAAFEKERADLEKNHMGKWVLFHDLKRVGIYGDFQAAADEAVRKFGRGPYLIRQIGAPPVVLPASVLYHPIYGEDDALRIQRYAQCEGR